MDIDFASTRLATKTLCVQPNHAKNTGLGVIGLGIAFVTMGLIPLASADPAFTIYAGTDTLNTTSGEIGVNVDGAGASPVTFTGCGNGDTVVQRLNDVVGVPGSSDAPAVGQTLLAMTHLCMYTHNIPSHDPAYISLQTERIPSDGTLYGAGVPSGGEMIIVFDPSGNTGNFTSKLNVSYDVRDGSDGPIFATGWTGPITALNVSWERAAGTGDTELFCHHTLRVPKSWFVEGHCVEHASTYNGDFVPGKGEDSQSPGGVGGVPPRIPGVAVALIDGVPTLSEWGLLGLTGTLVLIGGTMIGRRKP